MRPGVCALTRGASHVARVMCRVDIEVLRSSCSPGLQQTGEASMHVYFCESTESLLFWVPLLPKIEIIFTEVGLVVGTAVVIHVHRHCAI